VYLKKAGLAISQKRGHLAITEEGQIAYKNGADKVTREYLNQFESFREFKGRTVNKKGETPPKEDGEDEQSPEEMLDTAVKKLNASLADDLLEEVMKISPFDFEKLVVDLLFKMGYGKPKDNNDAVTSKTGDEGIDGIVSADKFGFDAIYIQAKQWKTDSTVGRPEIQKFLGALAGQGATKGIFITTAQYSKEAKAFADKQLHSKIILVDGQDLAELMIEYNLGVSTNRVYAVKRIDTDYFNEYE
jgi:restriction system protein